MTNGQTTGEEAKQIVKELIDISNRDAEASPLAAIGERGDEYLRQERAAAVEQAKNSLEKYNKRLQRLALTAGTLVGWTTPLTYGFAYWVYAGTLPHISMGAAMGMVVICTAIGGAVGWWAGK